MSLSLPRLEELSSTGALHRNIVKIEALCSFLQGENVGNFQSLQKSFEEGSCATRATP